MIRLFLAGNNKNLNKDFEKLQDFLRNANIHCEYDFIDVLSKPEMANSNNISATPTIVSGLSSPSKKVVGDMGNPEKIAFLLGLLPEQPKENK